jgi:hypothetical protein
MFPTYVFTSCLPKTARRGASKSRAVIEQISVEVNTDVRLQAVWESLYKFFVRFLISNTVYCETSLHGCVKGVHGSDIFTFGGIQNCWCNTRNSAKFRGIPQHFDYKIRGILVHFRTMSFVYISWSYPVPP